jgi:thiamine pyrophosphate-dependent acetolactate synthase large subunit-like protein
MAVETPVSNPGHERAWGSDYLADVMREMDLEYIALTPGASFRGLHDSLVNHLGNEKPRILLCLHEEHTVAIAHGWAKVTGKPMAAFVHSTVGLMHATMAIFNAWCDRVPVVVFGATGAVDAARRRPWIEWIHTAQDQGALVRDYVKWDNQPASLGAAVEAMVRALQIAQTAPRGPVYLNFATELQEDRARSMPPLPDMKRFRAPEPARPAPEPVAQAARLLAGARNPVILAGRVSRDLEAWNQRVELAELLGARVLTDLKVGAAFPTDHPLHAAPPTLLFGAPASTVLRSADVVLSFDWFDLGGALRSAWHDAEVSAKVIQVSVDVHSHRGWSMDHQGLAPADLNLLAEPDAVLPLLLAQVRAAMPGRAAPAQRHGARAVPAIAPDGAIGARDLGQIVSRAIEGIDTCLIRLPLGWAGDAHPLRHPLDYLGYDGGGGIGSGPGMAIGAALALRGSGRLPVAVLGDGDFMMSNSALWTAARYGIPLLIVIANNRSFYNDEVHQEKVALQRGRPAENKWIGQHIGEPDIDFAGIARAQGAVGIGPAIKAGELFDAITEGIAQVRAGRTVVIDAHVTPGYAPAMVDPTGSNQTRN